MPGPSRRQFLATLGAASLAGASRAAAPHGLYASPGDATIAGSDIHEGAGRAGAASVADATSFETYGLNAGVIPLNTGTAGCTPRAVLDRVAQAAWQMERNPPRQAYGAVPGSLLIDAERERARCAAAIGSTPDELLVTRGTTDAMNTVAQSIAWREGDRILTSSAEHDGGLLCWRWVARRHANVAIDVVPIAPEETDTAAIVQRFAAAITPRTRVLSLSHVIAWTGLVMPIAEICAMARARGVLTVVDGAQALGNIPVDVGALNCDAYASTGHKWLLGPKGTGLLHVRKDAQDRIQPVAWEDSKRLCSEAMGLCPLPQVMGLGLAIERLQQRGIDAVMAHNLPLRNRLHAGLARIPGLRVVGPPPGADENGLVAWRLPDGVLAATLRKTLQDKDGLQVRAIDVHQYNGLRASLHVYNDASQVDALVRALRRELGAPPA